MARPPSRPSSSTSARYPGQRSPHVHRNRYHATPKTSAPRMHRSIPRLTASPGGRQPAFLRSPTVRAAPLAAGYLPHCPEAGRPGGMLTMAPVWFALRAGLRRKWRALVSLALLLGLAGGVVLTAAAGARRTDTAYPRLQNWANAAQLDVLPGAVVPPYFAALTRMPQVTAMSSAIQYNLGLPASGGAF